MQAKVMISTQEMSNDEWLKQRTRGIGGSDAAAIAGLNPWKAPIAVYMDKIGELNEKLENERILWGNLLEPIVADEFARRMNIEIREEKAILQHPEHEFMLANVDRIIVDPDKGDGILEIKTTGAHNKSDWEEGCPEYYEIQVHHYLAVTGLKWAYIVCLIGGQEIKYHRIERNEDIINALINIESDFWKNHVLKKIPPAFDGSESASNLLSKMYPEETNTEPLYLSDNAAYLVKQYLEASEEEKIAKLKKDEAGNQLKAIMGEHALGYIEGYKVSFKTTHRKGYEVKPTSYRQLRISEVKQ